MSTIDFGIYYKDNKLTIDELSWLEIKKSYSKKEIKENLHKFFEDYKPPFPYPEITMEEANIDFLKLKNLDSKLMVTQGDWNPKLDYKLPLSKMYINRNLTGRKSSAFFMNKERYSVGCYNKPSLYESWTNAKYRDKTFDAIFSLGLKCMNNARFLEAMRMKHYLPSQFSPAVAKSFYEYFDSKKILDMSAGWGDRLVGSCGLEYLGFDPNTKLTNNYKDIIKQYNLNAKVECLPFEDSNLPEEYFDTMFTSPPYFNRESYSLEQTQSSIRYKDIDEWLDNFLFISIDKIYTSLKKHGVLAINISDLISGKKRIEICDKMNNYISTKNMEYIGCYGLKMTKMLNSKSYYMEGVFGEPIWIWRKL